MKAAIYARYSTDKQRDASIDDQFYNCERMAERLGVQIVARFDDRKITGTHHVRPGYKAMLQAAVRGDFDVLIVDDLSRLARDTIETQQIIRDFKYRRQRVVAISDGFDSDDKSYKIQAGMRGMMNDIYIDDLRAKTHRGLSGKARAGRSTGGRVYGYRRKPIYDPMRRDEFGRELVVEVDREIEPEQAKWVQQIFEWYVAGYSSKAIAKKLNEAGVESPRNHYWSPSAIHGEPAKGTGILNNELYIGRAVWNRREWVKTPEGKRRPLDRNADELVVSERPDLRIISEDLWKAKCARQKDTKQRMAKNESLRHGGVTKYLFSGLLKCSACDSNYSIVGANLYGCSKHWNRGEQACSNAVTVRREQVEKTLLTGIKNQLLTPEAVREFIRECNALVNEVEGAVADDRQQAARRLKQVEAELQNLLGFIKKGTALPSITEAINTAEEERRDLQHQLKTAPPKPDEIMQMIPKAIERYRDFVTGLSKFDADLIPEAREHLKVLTGGEVRLKPFGNDGLTAEISGNYASLIGGHQVVMVAGARNGHYLMTFLLKEPTDNTHNFGKPSLRLVSGN